MILESDMNDRKQRDEISAYIDGEATAPERVETMLASKPELDDYHAGLSRVSERMRDWPEAEPRPGFANRVVAHIEANGEEAARRWLAPMRAYMAVAAVLVVGIVSFGVYAPKTTAPGATPPLAQSLVEEEQALVARLAERIVDTPAGFESSAAGLYVTRRPVEVYDDQLLVLLNRMETSEGLPAAWGRDYSTGLTKLDDAGRSAFKDVLTETYRRETAGSEI